LLLMGEIAPGFLRAPIYFIASSLI